MAKDETAVLPSASTTDESAVKAKKRKKKDKSTPTKSPVENPTDSPVLSSSKKKRKRGHNPIEKEVPVDLDVSENPLSSKHVASGNDTPKPKKKKKKRKVSPEVPSPDKEQLTAVESKPETAHEPGAENVASEDDAKQNTDPDVPEKRKRGGRKDRLRKATQSVTDADEFPPLAERQAHLHGLLQLPLAPPRVVRAMDDSTRHEYLTEAASVCHDLLGQLHRLVTAGETSSGDTMATFEDQLTTDMVRLRRLPLPRQYVEITLWQRVKDFVRQSLASAENLAYGAGEGGTEKRVGILRHAPGDVDVHFNSFRNAYLKDVVETYQGNLEKIQELEGLDKEQVGFLIKSLEAGADLFGNVACWDRRRDSEPNSSAATNAELRAADGQ